MKIIEKIKEPIAKEFEIFESEFVKSVNSGILILNVILKFMINKIVFDDEFEPLFAAGLGLGAGAPPAPTVIG